MTRIAQSLALCTLLLVGTFAAADNSRLDTLVVTGQRVPVTLRNESNSVSHLAANPHQHINEIAWHAPGTWISRGSGQEQLIAIRSPVLTGAGSCGAFVILEDGIPIRPTGFCNVNQLFEVNTGQADAIEIARGPVGAAWGANALHGAINVLMDVPRNNALSFGTGPDNFYHAKTATGLPLDGNLLLNVDHDGGFRSASGYDQGKLNILLGTDATPRIRFSATQLQQETAGFLVGADAYRDDALRTSNPNPEAFRDADSQRFRISWEKEWSLTVYARHSRMHFLQHFLPGQPVERNGQRSFGLNIGTERRPGLWKLYFGTDTEFARGDLSETQQGPARGSEFLRETRPAGLHYDYTVNSAMLGLWLNATRVVNERWSIQLAARSEYLHYDYDNRATTGNLRDDGSACGFGGCLYNRPADRSDDFSNFAPRVAVNGKLSHNTYWWLQTSSGFRPPQATELYRLQRGQDTAQLDSERLTSVETGLRFYGNRLNLELAAFLMRKKNFIFRDADGFNVSNGRTRHHGLEVSVDWMLSPTMSVAIDAGNTLHRYDFDREAALGETIADGAEIDTAPRHIASGRLRWRTPLASTVEIEWLHNGSYSMDAANSRRYPGHDLGNLRYSHPLNRQWTLQARLMNIADTRYAERADFAFGNSRYFPGRERGLYVDLLWSPSE